MRKAITLLCLLLSSWAWSQSQSHEFTIDYTVKYLINTKKGTKDTVTIGYEKNGKYLWSDYNGLVKEFASTFMKDDNGILSGSSNIIYSSIDGKLYMIMDLGPLKMTLDTEIAVMLSGANSNNSIDEEAELKSEKTDQDFILNDQKINIYKIYSDLDPHNHMNMAIDTSRSVDNNFLFQNFMNLMLNATDSTGDVKINLPNGIILSITEPTNNNNTVLEAISINETPLKISINNSFKISE